MAHSFEEVCGAVARGWCSPENSSKEMDSDLATAIAKEVWKLYHPVIPIKTVSMPMRRTREGNAAT